MTDLLTSVACVHDVTPTRRPASLPAQVLGKSCKPIPVMVMGAFLGKKYPLKKYANVALIVAGVALFMQSGHGAGKPGGESGGQVRGLRAVCCTHAKKPQKVVPMMHGDLGCVEGKQTLR